MTFGLLNRRIHLCLGLFLLLFFLRYPVTSILYNHKLGFNELYRDQPDWTERFSRTYDRPVPDDADSREIAAQIIEDAKINPQPFTVWKPNKDQLHIQTYDFFTTTRLTYFVDRKCLLAEDKSFRWDHFLYQFHSIGGYQQDNLIGDIWAFMNDLVGMAIIIWIITGLYMWYKSPGTRLWGCLVLGGGAVSFLIFVVLL